MGNLLPRRAMVNRLLAFRRGQPEVIPAISAAEYSAVAGPYPEAAATTAVDRFGESSALARPTTLLLRLAIAVHGRARTSFRAIGESLRTQWHSLRRLFRNIYLRFDKFYSEHPIAAFLIVTALLAFWAEGAAQAAYSRCLW